MKCPNCGETISVILRVISAEVAFTHRVSDHGEIGEDTGQPAEVLGEVDDGTFGERYLCPSCRQEIEIDLDHPDLSVTRVIAAMTPARDHQPEIAGT